jgi:hypothetical protein
MLTVATFLENLASLEGREFKTIFQEKPFKLVFYDTVKLRIGLPDRDISVPISILLFCMVQLLAVNEVTKKMCTDILGKDWGFAYVARLLLECEDVCMKRGETGMVLTRVPVQKHKFVPIKPPARETVAGNPGNGHKNGEE